MKFTKLLKFINIGRLNKIITNLTYKEEVKALMKLTYFIFYLISYIHFISCLWYRVVSIDEVWIPPLDYVDYTARILFTTDDYVYKYLCCVYNMVACIGGNELGPVTAIECIFIVYCNIAAFILNAFTFGQLSFLITVLSKKSAEYQYKVDTANTAMKNLGLRSKT